METNRIGLQDMFGKPYIKKMSFLNIFLHIFGGVVAGLYSAMPGVNTYVSMVIISFILNELLIVYGCCQGAQKSTLIAIIGINIMGIVVQSVFGIEEFDERMKQCIIYLVAIFSMIAFAVITRMFKMPNRYIAFCSAVVSLGFLLVCCVMPEVNGARNWISIAGFSIQLTELVKFFAVIFLGSLYISNAGDMAKFIYSTLFTVITSLLLVVRVNEMGTLLVIALIYITLFYMFNRIKWLKIAVSVLAVLFILILVAGYKHIDNLSYSWECPSGCTVTIEDENGGKTEVKKILHGTMICEDCNVGKLNEIPTYICSVCNFRKFEDMTDEEKKDYKCEVCSDDILLGSSLGSKLSKLYNRFSIWVNYDIMRYEDSAYQIARSETSAILGGWFGTKDFNIYIPNMRNDSVIAGMLGHMGFVFVAIVLFLFYFVFMGIRKARSPLKVAAILAFVYQAMIAVMGNLNMFALTGIGVPMISTGGSIYIVSLLLIYIILTADSRKAGGKVK